MFYALEINELDDTMENNSPFKTLSSSCCVRKSKKRRERRGIMEDGRRNTRVLYKVK